MDKLVILAHAINGDGTVNAFIGPDTPAVRKAISALDDEYGPGMFEMADTPAGDYTDDDESRPATDGMARDLVAAISWWGSGCDGESADHLRKADDLLRA